MPVATSEKNGLMSKELVNRLIYKFTLKQDILYKITGSGVSVLAVSGNSASSLISFIFGNSAFYKLLGGALDEYHFYVWRNEHNLFYVKTKMNFMEFNCLIKSGNLGIEEAEPDADTSTMTKLQ